MKPFQHLLVATDLSPESAAAAHVAAKIARTEGVEVTVVYVMQTLGDIYQQFTPPIDVVVADAKIRHAASAALDTWVKEHLAHIEHVTTTLQSGDAAEAICEVARKSKATMIVMTTHGRHGLQRLMVGSVTEHVLRDAPCPVLVVPLKRA